MQLSDRDGGAQGALSYVELAPHTVRLSDADAGPVEQTILREGCWKHAGAPGGELNLNKARLEELAENFRAGVGLGGDALPFHFGHTEDKDERSVAWGRSVRVVPDPERPGMHKMTARLDFTSDASRKAVLGGEYAFTSPTILFGVKDRDSGKTYGAVLRNVAFTNYPFIQKMGRARVVNLSEVAAAAKAAGVNKGAGLDFGSGGPAQGEPNPDGLPEGYDLTELPKQCLTCAKLGNDCPFAAPKADDDLALKQAAAGSGNCPQYVPGDSQSPGGGGAADAANRSPAAGRKAGAAMLSEGGADGDAEPGGATEYNAMLYDAAQLGAAGTDQDRFASRHGAHMHRALREKHLEQFERRPDGARRGDGKGPTTHVRITRAGQAALAKAGPPPAKAATQTARMSDTDAGTRPPEGGAASGPTVTKGHPPMNKAQQENLAKRLLQIEADEQKAFVTALAEEHELPAAQIKVIDDAMTTGGALSVRLSQALDGSDAAFVQLAEKPDQAVTKPAGLEALLSEVDLTDTITLPKSAYRAAILAAASAERTGVQLGDTRETPGAPDKKKDDSPDDIAKSVQAERDPGKALELARKAASDGKI